MLPELPEVTEPMSGEQLQKRYGISKSQFHNRKNAMPFIQGFTHARKKLFSVTECFQLDAAHYYLKQGFTLEDLSNAYKNFEPEGIDDSVLEVENLEKGGEAVAEQMSLVAIDPSVRQFSSELGKLVVQAVQEVAPRPLHDPLRPQRLLKEAAEDQFEITSKMLSEILELKISTIHSFDHGEERLGFRFNKSGKGKWFIERMAA